MSVWVPGHLRILDYRSYLSSLVLGDLVLCVLLAGLALAVGAASLRNVDLKDIVLALCFNRVRAY